MTSFSVVSLIAMVPESECRMPTLIGPAGWARAWNGMAIVAMASAAPSVASLWRDSQLFSFLMETLPFAICPHSEKARAVPPRFE